MSSHGGAHTPGAAQLELPATATQRAARHDVSPAQPRMHSPPTQRSRGSAHVPAGVHAAVRGGRHTRTISLPGPAGMPLSGSRPRKSNAPHTSPPPHRDASLASLQRTAHVAPVARCRHSRDAQSVGARHGAPGAAPPAPHAANSAIATSRQDTPARSAHCGTNASGRRATDRLSLLRAWARAPAERRTGSHRRRPDTSRANRGGVRLCLRVRGGSTAWIDARGRG